MACVAGRLRHGVGHVPSPDHPGGLAPRANSCGRTVPLAARRRAAACAASCRGRVSAGESVRGLPGPALERLPACVLQLPLPLSVDLPVKYCLEEPLQPSWSSLHTTAGAGELPTCTDTKKSSPNAAVLASCPGGPASVSTPASTVANPARACSEIVPFPSRRARAYPISRPLRAASGTRAPREWSRAVRPELLGPLAAVVDLVGTEPTIRSARPSASTSPETPHAPPRPPCVRLRQRRVGAGPWAGQLADQDVALSTPGLPDLGAAMALPMREVRVDCFVSESVGAGKGEP